MHKPLLHTSLFNWEQKAQPAELLKLENCDAMTLRHFPDIRLAKDPLRGYGCHSVEGVIDNPVEHFYQKGVFLEDSGEEIVSEARGIRCVDDEATYPSRFWERGCNTQVFVRGSIAL